MMTKGYLDYINSDAWKRKRQVVFAHYGKKCYACKTMRGTIHVHHLDYSKLGHETLNDLLPLCVPCHRDVTKIYRRNRRRGLRWVTMEYVAAKHAALGIKT